MTIDTNYIVFQCYGNEGVFHECAYALLSLSRLYQAGVKCNIEIWIYTDNPGWFEAFKDCTLSLHFRAIDKATINEWRGSIDFVHRVKIEVLKDFCKDKKGNVLYTDTDVVFTHHPDEMLAAIEGGALYMHVMEGRVSEAGNPVMRKLNNYLQANVTMQVNGKGLQELAMWNAGVLGFNTDHAAILDEVLAFTDQQYPKFPKHIIEQFAFSVFFRQAGEIKAAAPYLLHYWNLKEARLALAAFFGTFKGRSWAELVRYSSLLQMHVLMQEKANFFSNLSIADKMMKKRWQPNSMNWPEIIKQI